MSQGIAVPARSLTIAAIVLATIAVGLLALVGSAVFTGIPADGHPVRSADVGWNAAPPVS
ncbi:hypothetical protein ABT095_25765 [Kitasatospora sp. NPDC002227]|uniref:hypothetical protein n=1 Tax=Kitasatospora sp. NPDC002227 TaxID=3154773 RepID=UPI00332EB18E